MMRNLEARDTKTPKTLAKASASEDLYTLDSGLYVLVLGSSVVRLLLLKAIPT